MYIRPNQKKPRHGMCVLEYDWKEERSSKEMEGTGVGSEPLATCCADLVALLIHDRDE